MGTRKEKINVRTELKDYGCSCRCVWVVVDVDLREVVLKSAEGV